MRGNKKIANRGSVISEVAISAPVFLLILLLGLEFLRVCYVSVSLHHAANKGARYASLFRVESGLTRAESIRYVMKRSLPFTFDETELLTYVCPAPATSCAPTTPTSTPHQMIAVSAHYDLHTVIGGLTFPLLATVVTRNEPFN